MHLKICSFVILLVWLGVQQSRAFVPCRVVVSTNCEGQLTTNLVGDITPESWARYTAHVERMQHPTMAERWFRFKWEMRDTFSRQNVRFTIEHSPLQVSLATATLCVGALFFLRRKHQTA